MFFFISHVFPPSFSDDRNVSPKLQNYNKNMERLSSIFVLLFQLTLKNPLKSPDVQTYVWLGILLRKQLSIDIHKLALTLCIHNAI